MEEDNSIDGNYRSELYMNISLQTLCEGYGKISQFPHRAFPNIY